MSKLRFAIWCRVSTEGQEKDGNSLEVQKSSLTNIVKQLDGVVVKEYIIQESAMGIKKRDYFTEMLVDCSLGIFDAVIIWDFSRISRNQSDTVLFIDVFKKNNIKLYTQYQEYNLKTPEFELQAGMFSLWNNYQVNIQKRKAMLSKIVLAKRGWPFSNPPYGRKPKHRNKSQECEWEIIPECQEETLKLYKMYVEEEIPLKKIASKLGMACAQVRRILIDYSDDVWIQQIRYDNNEEDIATKIPPLLTKEQIQNVLFLAKKNKKDNAKKYDYLLGGRIKCGVCKLTFIGTSSLKKSGLKQYYVHGKEYKTDICIKTIPLEIINAAVLRAISELFSSTKNLRMAIENAIGVSKDRKELLLRKIEEHGKEMQQLEIKKTRLVNAVLNGTFTDEEVSDQMSLIRENIVEGRKTLKLYEEQLKTLMIEIPDDLHLKIKDYYEKICGEEGSIADWSFESQEKFISWFFGKDRESGVVILKGHHGISFNVVGALSCNLVGVIETDPHSLEITSGVIGLTSLNHSFNSKLLTDFQRIIADLGIDTSSQALKSAGRPTDA